MGEVVMSNENGGSASASGANSSSVVKWERFLPKMVVRVLLVESDDSTRQIITALLRKCSYKVAAVSDGLKAWELLKGRPHNIDLILTEVDLPAISGFSLLTLIMDHKICKNIPIIMMSSQDSVNTVYKCMMRGAADFLVKPIRKNEMKNLWQHVWRRQSSSGGFRSPDESIAQQKFEATAENNAISNHSSDYTASIKRNRECIEKGNDAQSSCTKPEMDVEGADVEYIEERSQPKRSKSPSSDVNMQQEEEGFKANDNDLQMRDADDSGSQEEAGVNCETMTQSEEDMNDDHLKQGKFDYQTLDSNHILADSSREAIDLIGACDNYLKCNRASSDSNIANKIDTSPQLDLSLRRSHPCGTVNDESHRLNHSDASAFSWYVNKAFQPQQSTSPSTCNQQKGYVTLDYNSDAHAPTRHIPLANDRPGQAEIAFTGPQKRVLPAPIPVRGMRFENVSNGFGTVMPPMFCIQSGVSPMQSSGSGGNQEVTFHSLDQQPRNSQQFNSSKDQITNHATDQSENKQEHRPETFDNRGHFSSADQSANSSYCKGMEEAFSTPGVNSHRTTLREAALNKFRLKRKERCFEKKVRYESRKKLAEQRPRVKGQFVRQMHNEPATGSS